MLIETACQALRDGKCLELRYDGFIRVVEVHIVGATKGGNEAMRVWQVRGGSTSQEFLGFKLLRLDEATSAHIIAETSGAPRRGYNPRDRMLTTIYCRI